jgi:hypothetical protein
MLFATITEIGHHNAKTRKALEELSHRAQELAKAYPCQHYLVKTFGSTDLIEVALFDHYFRFAQVSSSSVQTFHRSVGVHCPEEKDLPRDRRANVCTAEEVLRGRSEIEKQQEKTVPRPFLAVVFMGLSPIPQLCLPGGKRPLAYRVLEGFCAQKSELWTSYSEVLKASCSDGENLSEPLVAPLIGLDSVEVVVLVRASRLEQLAAFAWAIRSQTLGDLWPAEQHDDALDRTMELLDLSMEQQKLGEHWDSCSVYRGSATVVGMPLQSDVSWRIELPGEHNLLAAETAAFLTHASILPGSTHPLGGGIVGEDIDQAAEASPGSFFLLFDRADALWATGAQEKLARRWTVGQVHEFLSGLSGLGKPIQHECVWTSTEVAVRMTIPDRLSKGSDELLGRFRKRLRDWREIHLNQKAGWTHRWLRATKRSSLSYSVNNVVVNLIPWNPVEDIALAPPRHDDVEAMANTLRTRGITTTVRRPRGRDVGVACGQLRRRAARGKPG